MKLMDTSRHFSKSWLLIKMMVLKWYQIVWNLLRTLKRDLRESRYPFVPWFFPSITQIHIKHPIHIHFIAFWFKSCWKRIQMTKKLHIPYATPSHISSLPIFSTKYHKYGHLWWCVNWFNWNSTKIYSLTIEQVSNTLNSMPVREKGLKNLNFHGYLIFFSIHFNEHDFHIIFHVFHV